MTDPASLDDARLMRAVSRGDQAALTVLYDRHSEPLFTFLLRWTGDDAAAEDLMHETFLRLLEPKARFAGKGKFRTWLFTIARNLATDRHRREQRMAPLEAGPPPMDGAPDALTGLVSSEERERLALALRRVTSEQREVLLLRTHLPIDHQELGRILGCTAGAARVRVHRAVRALRAAWDAQGEAT